MGARTHKRLLCRCVDESQNRWFNTCMPTLVYQHVDPVTTRTRCMNSFERAFVQSSTLVHFIPWHLTPLQCVLCPHGAPECETKRGGEELFVRDAKHACAVHELMQSFHTRAHTHTHELGFRVVVVFVVAVAAVVSLCLSLVVCSGRCGASPTIW